MTTTKAKAPCRIDLFGGTLDLWPLYLWFQPCATANVAISVFTESELAFEPQGNKITLVHESDKEKQEATFSFPLDPTTFSDPWKLSLFALDHFAQGSQGTFTLTTRSEAPLGSGLAASSSQLIATLSVLNYVLGKGHSKEQLQKQARDIETQILKIPAGEQDYYPALFGGVGALNLEVGQQSFSKFSEVHQLFQQELLVYYTGTSHHSGLSNWEIYQNVVSQEEGMLKAMKKIASNSTAGIEALQHKNTAELKKAIRQDWEIRKEFFPHISTPQMAASEEVLKSHQIDCYKACGAAAGGCMFTLVEEDKRERITEDLSGAGMSVFSAKMTLDGVTITP